MSAIRARVMWGGVMAVCAVVVGVMRTGAMGENADKESAMTTSATTMATTAPDRLVLEGVPRIGFDVRLCPFPGSVEAAMKHMKEPVDYDTLMAVSGACFRRTFNKDDGGNVDLLYFSPAPQRRVFWALGYEYRSVSWEDRGKMLVAIRESLGAGRPAIACGIVGPPEAGLVTGYEAGGDVLMGYSYFQDRRKFPGTFAQPDWYNAAWRQETAGEAALGPRMESVGVLVIGKKKARPTDREVLGMALTAAVEMARVARRSHLPKHVCGQAAYQAWADGLEMDADYPKGDAKMMETRAMVYADQVMMLTERRHAATFFRKMAKVAPEATGELEAAADLYENVARVENLWPWKSHWFRDAEIQDGLADRTMRRKLAGEIRKRAKDEEEALKHVEMALALVRPLPASFDLATPSKDEITRGKRWQVEDFPNAMALRAAMNVLHEDSGREVKGEMAIDLAYHIALAASGDSFSLGLRIQPDGTHLPAATRPSATTAADTYSRMLESLGYSGEILIRPVPPVMPGASSTWSDTAVLTKILQSLVYNGKPVLLLDMPEPGLIALVTGYEKNGEILHGWFGGNRWGSMLLERNEFMLIMNMIPKVAGVVFIQERVGCDPAYCRSRLLTRAIDYLRRKEADGLLAGPALFEAWTKAMEGPALADDAATSKHFNELIDPYIWDLADRRLCAVFGLIRLGLTLPDHSAVEILAAVKDLSAIHDLMWKINRTGGGKVPGDLLPKLTDAAIRKEIAGIIREAGALDASAAGHLEKALSAMAEPATQPVKR